MWLVSHNKSSYIFGERNLGKEGSCLGVHYTKIDMTDVWLYREDEDNGQGGMKTFYHYNSFNIYLPLHIFYFFLNCSISIIVMKQEMTENILYHRSFTDMTKFFKFLQREKCSKFVEIFWNDKWLPQESYQDIFLIKINLFHMPLYNKMIFNKEWECNFFKASH